ncbi:MAG: hypothetical protein JNM93_03890 [Bacteriovoracaceae bacterium]|nr:hypothetical protein [Bacteriovoracaceae bacterium]
MKYMLALFMMVFSGQLMAQDQGFDFLTFDVEERTGDHIHKSAWKLDMSLTALQYQPNIDFQSSSPYGQNFNQDRLNTIGTMIEFGREYYLTSRLVAGTKLQGYYSMLDSTSNKAASKTLNVNVSSQSNKAQVYGAGVSQMIGINIESKKFVYRPFLEYAVGYGAANSNLKYNYQLSATDKENYDLTLDDQYLYNALSAGFAFISPRGISSFIKISRMGLLDGKSVVSGNGTNINIDQIGVVNDKIKPKEISLVSDANYILSIGFGYYF